MRKLLSVAGILVFSAMFFVTREELLPLAYADTTAAPQQEIDANTQEISTLNQEIAKYQAELTAAEASKKTLQGAINTLNLQTKVVQTQISATQKQIATTQLQIIQLGTGIASTQGEISDNESTIGDEMRSLQEFDGDSLFIQLLSTGSISQLWDTVAEIEQVQDAIEGNIGTLKTQKSDLTASQQASQQKQDALAAQKKTYTTQQASLLATTQAKSRLLTETNASEATYQKLLAQAQEELQSFSTFTQVAGGSALLSNQTSCDAWGCYYNQRDSQWGHDALNGTQYNLASDGCLVTAMAMVMTHYGYRDVTPVSINNNPNNFAAYYPAYLLYTINVDGVSATRKTATIDATLAGGTPVVIGLNAYGGTHFVVFVSGSHGNYIMRDPYIPSGKDISFSAHYSINSIFGITKVVISG